MKIGVVGLNHKLADVRLRELLAQVCDRRFGAGASIHPDRQFLVLSTCNRTEIYYSAPDLADAHSYVLAVLRGDIEEPFDQQLYAYFGADCFLHLVRVITGLDSAILGETEIQGQVKRSYEQASQYNSLTHDLHFAFQKGLHIGKKVRSDVDLSHVSTSIEWVLLDLAQQHHVCSVLFLGASEINARILQTFSAQKGMSLTVSNRCEQRGENFARQHGTCWHSWKERHLWHQYDMVVLGTKSSTHLITPENTPNYLSQSTLIVDLCVPRNVDPKLGNHPQVTLVNIDQVDALVDQQGSACIDSLLDASALISRLVGRHVHRFCQKRAKRLLLTKPEPQHLPETA